MTRAWRALIIAPDNFPDDYGDYAAACRELKLEPNGHCYLVCLISTADRPRTLLTVDLALLPGIDEAGLLDQATQPGADPSTKIASGTGVLDRGSDRDGRDLDPEESWQESPTLRSPTLADRASNVPRLWGHWPSPTYPPLLPGKPEGTRQPSGGTKRNSFGEFCRTASPSAQRQPNQPHVQLVLDLHRATLKSVAVWNPNGPPDRKLGIAAKADDAVKSALRETFADPAAQVVIDRLWPPHAPPAGLADLDTAITVLQAGLEPQTLLLKMINAAAHVAAVHAGFGLAAPLVGQFAENLCRQFVPPTPTDEIMVNVLSSIDIDLYAAADKLPDCAELRELTVQETSLGIEELFKARFGVDPPGPDPAPDGPSPDPRDPRPDGPSPSPRDPAPGEPSPNPRHQGTGRPSPNPRHQGPGGLSPV
jgi:hypothetical protein